MQISALLEVYLPGGGDVTRGERNFFGFFSCIVFFTPLSPLFQFACLYVVGFTSKISDHENNRFSPVLAGAGAGIFPGN